LSKDLIEKVKLLRRDLIEKVKELVIWLSGGGLFQGELAMQRCCSGDVRLEKEAKSPPPGVTGI